MNRRHFLLATAGATLTIPLSLLAKGRSAISFLVVTDTHLGYRDQETAEKQWSQVAAQMAMQPGAFVLHLGDVVDGGRETQYPKYLDGRKLIGKPVHEVPGNHDPQELFQKYLRQEVDAVIEHEWLRVLLINNSHFNSHEGFITPEQIAWLSTQCAAAAQKDQLVLCAMHVPVHHNLHPDRGWFVTPANGQTAFYELMKEHSSRVLALFHGHFHNGLRGWDDHAPLHEVCFPSALYNENRKLEEQKAPGYNPIEFRPGFSRVAIHESAIEVQFYALAAGESLKKELPITGHCP